MLTALAEGIRARVPRRRPSAPRPPGPAARYPGDFLRRLVSDKLGLFGEMATHGDVTQITIGPRRVALLMHPDDIKVLLVTQQRNFSKGRGLERTKALLGEGLLTSEGEAHLRQRRLVQPAFHRERLAGYGATMTAHAARMQSGWAVDTVQAGSLSRRQSKGASGLGRQPRGTSYSSSRVSSRSK